MDNIKVSGPLDVLLQGICDANEVINKPIVNEKDEVIGHIASIDKERNLWYGSIYGGISESSILRHSKITIN